MNPTRRAVFAVLMVVTLSVIAPPGNVVALQCANVWSSSWSQGYASLGVVRPSPNPAQCSGGWMHGNYGVAYSQAYINVGTPCSSHYVGVGACVPNTTNCTQGGHVLQRSRRLAPDELNQRRVHHQVGFYLGRDLCQLCGDLNL